MDFLGFHPLYVVILLALALIIFGPSRLPKMGAQMGRMLREFQAAREGLTQQMRDAFEEEEEPETNFATSTGSVDEETEPESDTSTVAVLDPPPDGQATPEALGTAPAGAEAPSGEVSLGDAAAAGVTAALHSPQESEEGEEPAAVLPPEEPETAALHAPVPTNEPETGDRPAEPEAPALAPQRAEATVAAHHDTTAEPRDEENRAD